VIAIAPRHPPRATAVRARDRTPLGVLTHSLELEPPDPTAGLTPPLEGAKPEELRETARKFVERSATLATDGFIVYDIQEEKGRTPEPRPFPFRKLDDPSHFAQVLKEVSGKESVVYKCVAEADPGGFDNWLETAIETYGVNAYNLVGGASSANQYSGPTIPDVAAKLNARPQCAHGGVTIAERHIKKGNEHETLVKKSELGMKWFISQAIYDPEPMIKLLKEYGALCKQRKIAPKRVVLTFAPCGREKTMRFIKWLGVTVPEDVEKEILEAENKVGKSVDLLCGMCKRILEETKGCGVPLGVSVESVSIFKNEIDAAHELFRRTQSMLLDFLGEPWLVRYSIVDTKSKRTSFDYVRPAPPTAALPSTEEKPANLAGEDGKRTGILVGAGLALGLVLGKVLRI
jgi:hypothetical protein